MQKAHQAAGPCWACVKLAICDAFLLPFVIWQAVERLLAPVGRSLKPPLSVGTSFHLLMALMSEHMHGLHGCVHWRMCGGRQAKRLHGALRALAQKA